MRKCLGYILGLAVLAFCMAGCREKDMENETAAAGREAEKTPPEEKTGLITPEEVPQIVLVPEKQEPAPQTEPTEEEKRQLEMEQWVEEQISSMAIEQQVAQLFFVGNYVGVDQSVYPVGGLIYFENDLQNPEQTRAMLQQARQTSQSVTGVTVFTAVDEEGGSVTRVAGNPAFELEDPGNMADLGSSGDTELVQSTMKQMGTYLKELGFDTDFAPVADISTEISNYYTKLRSFSGEPQTASDMVTAAIGGLHEGGIGTAAKHFPGLGHTSEDSHEGKTVTTRTLEEMQQCELLPFQAAIDAGTDFVMVGHVSAVNVDTSGVPATLSPVMVDGILREQMGYDGIVITDAMNMGAIVNQYSSGEAAVKAILAGVDMILMPADFESAYNAVLSAVTDGTISQERLQQSLRRILTVKYSRKD